MNDTLMVGLASGIGVGIAMLLIRRRSARLEERIVPLLRERGAMTLPELTEALGMGGLMARGKVVLALGQMQMEKRLDVIPAPEGTPQLQKGKHIKYRLPEQV